MKFSFIAIWPVGWLCEALGTTGRRASRARPVATHMQPEAVRGRHEDACEAPVRMGHPPGRHNR